MLSGEYRHNIDTKNRLFVPSKHREELGEALKVARSSRDSCLRIYSVSSWDAYCMKVKEKLDGMDAEKVLRFLNRNAESVEPDSQGRITVPSSLLEYAGVSREKREVVIVGCGEYAEIWSAGNYDALIDEENADTISALLAARGM